MIYHEYCGFVTIIAFCTYVFYATEHDELYLLTFSNFCYSSPLIRAALFYKDAGMKDSGSAATNTGGTRVDPRDIARKDTATVIFPPFLEPFILSQDMQARYKSMLPEEVWVNLSPALFLSFFSYSLYDLHCPKERYIIEATRLKREVDRLTQLQRGGKDALATMASLRASKAAAGGTEREVREAASFTKAHRLELERVQHNSEVLASDATRQDHHVALVRSFVEAQKHLFFLDLLESGGVIPSKMFMTHCVYPRCLMSPEDAIYCFRFVMLLHEMETPGFQTLKLFDTLINAVVGSLYCSTEDEAACIGILLDKTLKLVSDWRYDDKLFEKCVEGKVRL